VQGIRAADSIGANIAEAMGRITNPDRLRLLFIARGSVNELEHWLARAEARRLPCPPKGRSRAREIGRMLNGLIASIPS
jgi:four helix bundle protein